MLLRSVSSPIPNSWTPTTKDLSPGLAAAPQLLRSRSIARLTSSASLPPQPITRALSEAGLPSIPSPEASMTRLVSSSGLDGVTVNGGEDCCAVEWKTLVDGDGNGGSGGRRVCWGGGDGGGGFVFQDTDAYYLKMIEANPGDSLLLGNYAKFLKEVKGDFEKAEKYCERAILVNPGDADVLSLYAGLIWETGKDAERAEKYFDQAVHAAPQDSYVMASYARFLWDANDDEEEDGSVKESNFSPPPLFQGSTMSSVAAAS